ncbi:MAG: hypothetical protein R2795_17210 [Saprospiraceae bacterium]
MSKILSIGYPDSYREQILPFSSLEMLVDASGIDCAFRLEQNKIFSLSLNQRNLDILLA